MGAEANPVVLYDGVCGLCNRFVQFILKRDRRGIFRFAALQGELAHGILNRHGTSAVTLDTVYLVTNLGGTDETLRSRSDAALAILRRLGGGWKALAALGDIFPRPLRDWGYDLIATNRYRVFGKYDTCPVPDEHVRSRFLDR